MSAILKGEIVKIQASKENVKEIVLSSVFYAVPASIEKGMDVKDWLIFYNKPRVGVVSADRHSYELFIKSFCFQSEDVGNYQIIRNISDTNGYRFHSLLLDDENKTELYNICKSLIL
jgi:hypothetical protein